MKGLVIKLIDEGRVMEEVYLTRENSTTSIRTKIQDYNEVQLLSTTKKSLISALVTVIKNYDTKFQSNENLGLLVEPFLYDKKD